MKMNKRFILPLILFITLVFAFAIQLFRNAEGEDPRALESALIGKTVPGNQWRDLENLNITYSNNIFKTGKPQLINVWATWCPTCYAEHQFLRTLDSQGIPIIGVDYKDERNKAITWLKRLGNPYKIVLDDSKGSFALDLGVYGAPETFLIDGQGIIRYRHAGDLNQEVWSTTLKPIYEKLLQGEK